MPTSRQQQRRAAAGLLLQERFWFLNQFEPQSAAYNLGKVAAPVRPAERVVTEEIVRRHVKFVYDVFRQRQ